MTDAETIARENDPRRRAWKMGYRPFDSGAAEVPDYPLVDTALIYDDKGQVIPNYQRIWRRESGDTLAIHTEAYQLRPYGEGFAMLEAAIMESNLERSGMMTKTEFSHNGARCFRSYLFPEISVQVAEGDAISLQILGFDSYDGTYSTSIAAGGFRSICLNGNFFGKTIQQMKVRHTKGSITRFENGLDRVIAAADEFTRMEPRLKRWVEVPIDAEGFHKLVGNMPQANDRLADHLLAQFVITAEQKTLYGAWNVLTSWATRGVGTAQTRVDRDRRVAALVESVAWRRREDTA